MPLLLQWLWLVGVQPGVMLIVFPARTYKPPDSTASGTKILDAMRCSRYDMMRCKNLSEGEESGWWATEASKRVC